MEGSDIHRLRELEEENRRLNVMDDFNREVLAMEVELQLSCSSCDAPG